ncbi:hypothetical protein WMY93_010731 [Mugilogobius chulae]|uniref:Uncharacterized protein n=1 Tax=Mugilogobius chulae TaxID=88201 RepID=A0AAW0P859_9GOBI
MSKSWADYTVEDDEVLYTQSFNLMEELGQKPEEVRQTSERFLTAEQQEPPLLVQFGLTASLLQKPIIKTPQDEIQWLKLLLFKEQQQKQMAQAERDMYLSMFKTVSSKASEARNRERAGAKECREGAPTAGREDQTDKRKDAEKTLTGEPSRKPEVLRERTPPTRREPSTGQALKSEEESTSCWKRGPGHRRCAEEREKSAFYWKRRPSHRSKPRVQKKDTSCWREDQRETPPAGEGPSHRSNLNAQKRAPPLRRDQVTGARPEVQGRGLRWREDQASAEERPSHRNTLKCSERERLLLEERTKSQEHDLKCSERERLRLEERTKSQEQALESAKKEQLLLEERTKSQEHDLKCSERERLRLEERTKSQEHDLKCSGRERLRLEERTKSQEQALESAKKEQLLLEERTKSQKHDLRCSERERLRLEEKTKSQEQALESARKSAFFWRRGLDHRSKH